MEKTFMEIEQEAWDQRADYYDDLFAAVSKQAIPDILDDLGSLAGKRHLDIACGTGHLVAEASRRGAISEGTDFSQSMIDAAHKNYPGERFSLADAARLPFESGSFDAVTCAFGISHMENPQQAIDEAFRVLASGGRFAFTLWFGPDDGNELQAIVKHAVASHAVTNITLPDAWTQLRFADEQICATMVRQAGFGRPEFKRLPIAWTSKNKEEVLAFVDKLFVRGKMVVDYQPPAVKRRIKETILIEAQAHRTNGGITMNWPALLVTARKLQNKENKMLGQYEAKYTLFDSVQEMLLPDTLSALLSQPVSSVEQRPMSNHNGLAGGRLSYVYTDNGRYVLKNMSVNFDWLMHGSEDHRGRSVTLWQYGLLDRLCPHLEHRIIACARNNEGWAILMHDLGEGVLWWDQPAVIDMLPLFLDALARLHATFWNDPILLEERIGLSDAARMLNGTSLTVARNHANTTTESPIPVWIVEGWQIMEDLLDRDVYEQMYKLIEDPRPLFAALDRYPFTLLHGDYRDDNLAILPPRRLVAFDWQQAAHSLMTIDLVWFTEGTRELISEPEAQRIYREHLQRYLQYQFDDSTWQAMIDLGYLFHAIRITWIQAYFIKHGDDSDELEIFKTKVLERKQRVQNGLRWL
jgi:ubiquinone/menaquinone biosynthesis C-methylase UbiE